jgi:quercetin dioxygenase-like cupin family protein
MKIKDLADVPSEGLSHDPEVMKQVILRAGEVPHLTNLSRAVLRPGQTASVHAHSDMFEIFSVLSGEGWIRIDERTYRLTQGVTVVVEPGENHEVHASGDSDLLLSYLGIKI